MWGAQKLPTSCGSVAEDFVLRGENMPTAKDFDYLEIDDDHPFSGLIEEE